VVKAKAGSKDYGPHTKGGPTITQEMRDTKAKADKEKRINALLDTMGYDKARKNAAYDALIDAGRMVSERGTLDPKNIGRELIDPIVAATSQRFDKPEQIREAVGLMQVKADIAKEMEDPQIKELRTKQMAIADKTIAGKGFSEVITDRITRGEAPTGATLASILRATEGIDAKVIDTAKKPQGKDALDWVTAIVKKSHEEGTPHPAGTFIVSNRVLVIDEQGNITPYL
jgi:DNA-binding transcriptional MocR family regulator